jgi:hypothetical protein
MRVFWLLLVLAGCPGNPGGGGRPDASDASDDGAPPGGGLYVEWRASPDLPGAINDRLVVSDASFQVEHLQVIGDTASMYPTRTRYMIAWNADGAPGQEAFTDAQAALYSKISLLLTGGGLGEFAYQIHGTWTDESTSISTPFTIEDRMAVNVVLNFQRMLNPGASLTLTIKIDLQDSLEHINFKALSGSGPIDLGGQDLIDFHNRMLNAFEIDDTQ